MPALVKENLLVLVQNADMYLYEAIDCIEEWSGEEALTSVRLAISILKQVETGIKAREAELWRLRSHRKSKSA